MANQRERIIVHIGLPKTGTTTLQELLFAKHPELAYLGQTTINSDPEAETVLRNILDSETDKSVTEVREIIRKKMAERGALVISDEALTFGEFMLRGRTWSICSNHSAVAARIKAVLGDVQIVIVLRNQVDWLLSWHRQGLKNGRYAEQQFEAWFKTEIVTFRDRLMELLNYSNLYEEYARFFGAERVHVFFFEDFAQRLSRLGAELASIAGVDPKIAASAIGERARNVTGSWFYRRPMFVSYLKRIEIVRRAAAIVPKDVRRYLRRSIATKQRYSHMDDATRQEIFEMFAESNRMLFEQLGDQSAPAGYVSYSEVGRPSRWQENECDKSTQYSGQ